MWMKPNALLVLTFLLMCIPAYAQTECPFSESEAIPDTLDPSGYYPLKVGNVWEYTVMDGAFMDNPYREKVIADTLIDEKVFYKIEKTLFFYDPDVITQADTSYRYLAVTDSSIIRWFRTSMRFESSPTRYNQDFNSCYAISDDVIHAVGGGYNQSFDIDVGEEILNYEILALKTIGNSNALIEDYAYGVGRVRLRGDPDVITSLVYATVDSIEYGKKLEDRFVIAVSSEHVEDNPGSDITPSATVSNFPNPFRDATELIVQTETDGAVSFKIVNVIGQIIDRPVENPYLMRGRHRIRWQADQFPVGTYFVQVFLNGKLVAVQSMTKIR